MGITRKWSAGLFDNKKKLIIQIIDKKIFDTLTFVGESFVNQSRQSGSYLDQTGNLRSSIGYLILKDGVVKRSDFKAGDKGDVNGKGVADAKAHAKEVSGQYSQGWVFIGVAGMQYAAAVESKGKEVITGSSLKAEEQLKRLLKSIKK